MIDTEAIRAAQGCDAGAVRVAGGDAVSADRCSFCERADVPLMPSKHAATCLDCARLAVEALSPEPLRRSFVVTCDCDGVKHQCSLASDEEWCDCPCHSDEQAWGAP